MTILNRLNEKYGNPLDWDSTRKASFLLDFYFVGQCFYFVSLYAALNSDWLRPLLNISLAEQHLGYFKLLLLSSVALIGSFKLASLYFPPSTHYEHAAAQYFAITHVYYGYTIGLMSLPSGVVLAGVTVLGFIILNRAAVTFAFLSALLTLALFTYATIHGAIPYAPLATSITNNNGQLNAVWVGVYFFFSLPLLLIIFGLSYYVLQRWRLREEQVQLLSTTDPLTGLLNRRSIMEHLVQAKEDSQKTGQPFAVIMVDLDHFKQINDTWGHSVGDSALLNAASALKRTLRQNDHVGRYGGEEFLVILPGLEQDKAQVLAERIRLAVAETKVHISQEEDLKVTASLGMYCSNLNQTLPLEELIKQADLALYQAKHGGRDKLVIAG